MVEKEKKCGKNVTLFDAPTLLKVDTKKDSLFLGKPYPQKGAPRLVIC